ncbi:MAG: anti-anti-sigma regulatory factor [Cytophagaceae bacterium]|jgi:anti-sigma B factor antagonist|nr:anti-anti-sigma regulatory factor [Cytophagaceae bacterium]
MNYTSQIKDQILFLHLEGDLIGETNGLELMELVNDKINSNILHAAIDLSNVRYMNSSGIGVLITLLTKFRNKSGEVVLINPSEQIKKLLIITKLNSIFNIVDNESQAVERLQK